MFCHYITLCEHHGFCWLKNFWGGPIFYLNDPVLNHTLCNDRISNCWISTAIGYHTMIKNAFGTHCTFYYSCSSSAPAANDFTCITGVCAVPVNFPPQSFSTVVRVPIRIDGTTEGTEQFFGRLRSSGTIADLNIGVDRATVDILDGGKRVGELCV